MRGYRRLVIYGAGCLTLTILALFRAPGEAYTALGLMTLGISGAYAAYAAYNLKN